MLFLQASTDIPGSTNGTTSNTIIKSSKKKSSDSSSYSLIFNISKLFY